MRPAPHSVGSHVRALRPGFFAVALTARVALATLAVILTGCQGMSRVQPLSQVRVIDVSPDAPAIDIHQNSSPGLYNVGFGTVSSYISVPPGAYTPTAYTAGTRQRLATVKASFLDGGQYTVLTGNTAAALQMTILRDQSTPAPPGQVALRMLNQTTRRGGAFDIYLLPAGSPLTALVSLASHAGFGTNTGYINAPSGTYSILAFSSGSVPSIASPIFIGPRTTYPSGAVRTLVLIDQTQPAQQSGLNTTGVPLTGLPPAGVLATPSLQIITANDFDPPSAS